MGEGLAWPPRKEDLERLYLREGLSAAKVAEFYGLEYKTPKVAESTVLFQLKKHGIRRRDPAERIRKVTPAMVDGWVSRYQAGESLRQVAGGQVDAVTVWNHLRARGVAMRERVEAQIQRVTKYERRQFSGDRLERAYLMGLRYGDLHAMKHGRAVRVRVSTTHPAMADLFESLFSPYGHVSRYPRSAKLTGYEWTLECDLDESFEFLLSKPNLEVLGAFSTRELVAFLAGLFDAEGSVLMHKKERRYNPEVAFSNSDRELIEFLAAKLRLLGFSAHVFWGHQADERVGIHGRSPICKVVVWRTKEVQKFLRLFRFRHQEKVAKADIARRYLADEADRLLLVGEWAQFKLEIRTGRERFIREAASILESARSGKSSR